VEHCTVNETLLSTMRVSCLQRKSHCPINRDRDWFVWQCGGGDDDDDDDEGSSGDREHNCQYGLALVRAIC
jgi:hypothetical protein